MVVVTGGSGFIGSAFVWKLNREGITDILIVDNFTQSPKWKNLVPLKFADVLDKDTFIKNLDAFRNVSAVVHMGAKTSTTEKDFGLLLKENFEYSKKLAEFCARHDIRFIYASSGATYGLGEEGFDDDEEKLENLKPLSPYGYSKHLFDLWMKRKGYLKFAAGLKFFNVFGPNEYHKGEMRSFALKCWEQLKNTGEVKLFKSYKPEIPHGEQKRDFVYVKDVVEVIWFFLENEKSGIYNVGTGEARSFNELVRAVAKAMDIEPKIKYIDMPEEIKNQYQYFTQASIVKLRRAGYQKQFTSLEKAVSDYISNYLSKIDYRRWLCP